jgi:UDP-N-acetylmuramate: L-alanyl-gamma-D-glutamyl-meso-diaminopimelate ligase
MRMGVHRDTLAASLSAADRVWLHQPDGLEWSLESVADALDIPVTVQAGIDEMVSDVLQQARPGDHVLVMSNGAFGGIHDKLLQGLAARK